MYYKIILLFSLLIGSTNTAKSQEKIYRNEFAYRVDSTIYNYENYESTKRTRHCKEIIVNQKRKNKNKWVENDWHIEKNELLKAKELIVVKHICLTENLLPSENCEPFLRMDGGTVLGPFQTDYGQFRFVKIEGGSQDLSQLSNGESKISGWILLENKRKPSKKIEKIAAEVIALYDQGVGSKKCVDRKLKRYEKNKAVASKCVCCSKDAEKKEAAAPAGNTWYTMNCPSGLAIVRMHKIPPYTRYVYYTEYIFK